MSELPIFISGAGPTGLLLSIWLTRLNVPHRVVDPNLTTGTTSRAIIVHARVLEFYDQLGFADRIVAAGVQIESFTITYAGKRRTTIPYGNAGEGQSKYPFMLSLGQDEHEAILQDELYKRGGKVERGRRVTAMEDKGDHVEVAISDGKEGSSGNDEVIKAGYVAGCDGAHSTIRKCAGMKMEGGTYGRRFFVADVNATGSALPGPSVVNMCLSSDDFCLAIRMKGDNRARLIGFTPENLGDGDITFEDCLPSIMRNLGPDTTFHKVNWFSHYKVHHRHADHFLKGRVFVFGDAAHLHSPVGGQGMNTGLGDVTNFAWKFASTYHASAKFDEEALLDTYSTERSAFAKSLVATTDTIFQYVTGSSYLARFIRTIVAPYIVPVVVKMINVAPAVYARTAQLAISYQASAISSNVGMSGNRAGTIHAGQRLPWVPNAVSAAGETLSSNLVTLNQVSWQAHVFGSAAWAEEVLREGGIAIHAYEWSRAAREKGFGKDVLYLVRPDGHVGLALGGQGNQEERALLEYMRRWDVRGE